MIEKTATAGATAGAAPVGSCRRAAAGVLLLGLFLAGCSGLAEIRNPIEHFDTDAEASRQDFREGLAARPPAEAEEPPPIPELQPIISAPALGVPEEARLVTVTVNETTPLKDVLIELARAARVDLELDPRIVGGVIFSAYERPFEDVIQRIVDLADLRYTIRDNVVRIEFDDPYHVNYRIGYLNLVRRATSQVGTESSVIGGDAGGGGGASSSRVSSESEANFWAELEANITQIMTNTGRFTGLVAPPEPVAAPAAAAPAPAPSLGEAITAPVAPAAAVPPAAPAAPAPTVAIPAAAPTLVTGAAAIQTLQPAFVEASDAFTINKQAGILSVFGSQRQHRTIEEYLRKVRVSISAQVLIEAKILEVSLLEQYRFGINWVSLFESRANFGAPFNTATTTVVTSPPFSALIGGATAATANVLTISAGGADLQTIVNLVQQFGTVRALSSPRITVMQNQTAVLKVAEEQVFFEIDFETTQPTVQGGTVVTTTTSTINTVTVGVVMTVQPSINLDTEEITLTLRPTITSVARTINDPAVDFEAQVAQAAAKEKGLTVAAITSKIPELVVQEIDTVVTMPSGSVLVIGGLMQDRITVDETGVPVLGEIPWLGQLFKSKQERIQKTELVILLRATITEGSMITPADAELYERFGGDRRPFPMQ
ncbi:MAG: type II and III secretion system family protein [Proteobacteria bacterium]|nr:type II and III secretion system family protein [Pseudomonadota bacterium]